MMLREGVDYSVEAERSVIGSMLISESAVNSVMSELVADDFHTDTCKAAFRTIQRMFSGKKPVDAVSILHQMRNQGDIDNPEQFIMQVVDFTPTAANVDEYVRIVKDKRKLRDVHMAAEAIALARTTEDAQKAIEIAASALSEQKPHDIISLQDAIGDVMTWLDSPDPTDFIRTGIDKLDEIVNLQKQWMCVIAGFPSDGKTLLALQMAFNMSREHKVGYFYMEGGKFDTAKRATSHATMIDYGRISKKRVRKDEFGDLAIAHTDAGSRNLDLIDAAGYTTSKIRAITAARGYDVVFVDYIQIVGRDDWRWDDTRAISKASRDLCLMASQLDCCVIALSQFHRLGNGIRRAPTMHDLRQSGQIEQDASVVMLLSEAGVAEWEDADGFAEGLIPADASARLLQIAKNRNGIRDRWMHLLMRGQFQRFDYWEPNAPPPPPEPPAQHMIPLPDDYPTPFDGRRRR